MEYIYFGRDFFSLGEKPTKCHLETFLVQKVNYEKG